VDEADSYKNYQLKKLKITAPKQDS